MRMKNRWYSRDGKAGLKNPKADKAFRRQMARLDAKLKKEEEVRREKALEKRSNKNKNDKENN